MKVQFKSPENMGAMLSRLKSWICRSTAQAKFAMHYNSFAVEYASHLTLSAADHVLVLWAHLSAGNKKTCKHQHDGFWYGRPPLPFLSWTLCCRCTFVGHPALLPDLHSTETSASSGRRGTSRGSVWSSAELSIVSFSSAVLAMQCCHLHSVLRSRVLLPRVWRSREAGPSCILGTSLPIVGSCPQQTAPTNQ